MTRLLRRSSRRYLRRHPAQAGLAVVGVALGVAVVVAIDLANASATRAFTLSTEAVTGRATHQVLGGPSGLPAEVFRSLVVDRGIDPAAPVVEGYLELPPPAGPEGRVGRSDDGSNGGGRVLRLFGVDPFSERPFRAYLAPTAAGRSGEPADLAAFLTRPGAALLSTATAARLGAAAGDRLAAVAAGRPVELEIVGLLDPADALSREALTDLAVVDVATAQELLGMAGRLTRIDLIAPSPSDGAGGDVAFLARVRSALPPSAELVPAGARSRSAEGMTRAFRLNLRALSWLALLCGLFLIYNTMTFSVVQRRTLLGTLRAVGVTRRQVLVLVLAEAVVVGAAGTALGLALGVGLAQGLVRLVTQTINDLYFVVAVRGLAVSWAVLAKGAAVGLGATVLAALAPALEAATAPPRAALTRSTLEAGARRAVPRATALGLALLALGGVLLALPGEGLVVAFAGLFGVLVGCALLTPAATVLLMRLARPVAGRLFGVLGRMAAGGVVAALSRTGVAVAALTVAVAVTVGVGTMIASFRDTVADWLDASLGADLYLTAPGGAGGFSGAALDRALVERLAAVPGVVRVDTIRRVEIASAEGLLRLVAIDARATARPRFEFRQGDPATAWPAFVAGRGVLISEPYAYRTRLGVGDPVRLRTDRGERELPVVAVVTSYASDSGLVYLARAAYEALFDDRRVSGASVTAAPGADLAALTAALRAACGDRAVAIESRAALKRGSLAVFDRTFKITAVLRLLAGVVAFIGVVSALTALQLERARELGVLRANGMTPRQVWGLVTSQTGLMGVAAGLLAVPVGLALAAVMIYVVNRRSFGWTMALDPAPGILLEALALAVGAALLAGLYPAYRMARTSPAVALREE